jgi:lipopolysaccharide export system protein LptC
MKAQSARLYPVILMALLAAATLWIERLVQPEGSAPTRAPRHVSDFEAEGFTLTQINREGQADTMLSATKGTHFADDGTTHLENPRLRQVRPGMSAVEVKARRGTVDRDGNQVELYDSVTATRAARADEPATRLDTSLLRIHVDRETADTTATVRLVRGESTLEGTGMLFDNKSGQLTLESRVRGRFVNTARLDGEGTRLRATEPPARTAP